MRVKVTQKQFQLLLKNYHCVSDRGLKLTMSGKTFKKIVPETYQMNEQRMFKVSMWFDSYNTISIVYAHNSSSAMAVAGKMFPKARIHSATPVKGKLC